MAALPAFRYNLASVSLVFALYALNACGAKNESSSAQVESVSRGSDVAEISFADVSTIQDVSLKDQDGKTTTVTPSYLPKSGGTAEVLTVEFYPKLSVPASSKFEYDESKWILVAGKNNVYVTGDNILEKKTSGDFTKGEIRQGIIKMRIRLTKEAKWPDGLTSDAAFETIDGRKALKIQPYYSLDGAVAPGAAGTLQGLSAAYLKDDIGTISAPATAGTIALSDSAFNFSFEPPTDTSAVDTTTGSVASVGKSNISGYVVVYWNDSECQKGGWSFKPNKVFDKKKSNADLSCAYPGIDNALAGASSCALGCSTDTSDDFFGKSANDIAAPFEIPTGTGTESAIKKGCYTVVRLANDRSNYSVNNAVNGERYGIMVYPIDSAGNIGLTRSRCLEAKPIEVSFASAKKSPNLGKTQSDCFVVTAASGSTQSPAVHYWRILRDAWLDPLGVSDFYYHHAKTWAAWLDKHPALKPPLNAFFEWSGRILVQFSHVLHKLNEKSKELTGQLLTGLQNVFVSTASADEPNGSASSALMLGFSQTRPSKDKNYYDQSFRGVKPKSLFVSQSFRLVDFSGELGLGYEVGGVVMNGKSADENNVATSLYGYGGGVLGEYRFRVGERPWVSPRVSYIYGKMRMREEAASVETKADTSKQTDSSSKSDLTPMGTVPVWQTYTTLRLALDISVTRLYGDDDNLIRYGYEAEDLMLTFFVGQHNNNGKVISTSGLQIGGGLTLIFR